MEVAAGLGQVRGRIAAACARAGRDPGSVRLIAVSKTKPLELIREAVAAGQTHFAENYAQELREKADALPGVEWHFVGALQTNSDHYIAAYYATPHDPRWHIVTSWPRLTMQIALPLMVTVMVMLAVSFRPNAEARPVD